MRTIPELDHPEGTGPASYWELVGALERLIDDEPTAPELVAMREEADADGTTRRVPVTQKHVAIETRKAWQRKLISGTDCEYPKLAAYILSLRETHALAENTTERLRRQAEEIATLRQKVRVLRSRVLEAVHGREELAGQVARLEEQVARSQRRAA